MPGHRAWIGLGGNQGDREALLSEAVRLLSATPGIEICQCSSRYETLPWGDAEQPLFLNAVIEVRTRLSPGALLSRLQAIETALGRQRTARRWGPRPIDLDLLVYEDQQLKTPDLEVPHPRVTQRAFVLVPLAEIAPALEIPGHGRVEELLSKVDVETVWPVDADPPKMD